MKLLQKNKQKRKDIDFEIVFYTLTEKLLFARAVYPSLLISHKACVRSYRSELHQSVLTDKSKGRISHSPGASQEIDRPNAQKKSGVLFPMFVCLGISANIVHGVELVHTVTRGPTTRKHIQHALSHLSVITHLFRTYYKYRACITIFVTNVIMI